MTSKLLHFLFDNIYDGYFTLSFKNEHGFNTYWYALLCDNKHTNLDAMQDAIIAADSNGYDVYLSTGTAPYMPEDCGKGNKRISSDTCYAAPAFFMDIDTLKDPEKAGKGKSNLPLSPEKAVDILAKLEYCPSLCVCSGYGVHAYWKLKTPLIMKSENDRAKVKDAMRKFAQYIVNATGWTDADTFASEPTRILRLDGTHNHKRGGFQPVEVIYENPNAVYDAKQIANLLHNVNTEKDEESAPVKVSGPAPLAMENAAAKDYLQMALSRPDSAISKYWNGIFEESDESKNDCTFMRQLIRYIGRNEAACLAAFEQSPYYASKDSAHKKKWAREYYRHRTYEAALRQFESMGWVTSAEKDAQYQANRAKTSNTAKANVQQEMAVHQAVILEPAAAAKAEEETKTAAPTTVIIKKEKEYLTWPVLAEYLQKTGRMARFNVIKKVIQYDGRTPTGKLFDTDSITTMLEDELKVTNQYSGVNDKLIINRLTYIARENSYNPVLKYLDSLTWDNVDRMQAFFDLVGVDQSDMISKTLVRKWLYECYAALHNTDEEPFPVDGVLCLIGNQGSGKTSLFAALALKTDWFLGGACINDRDKDTIIRALSNWITELGEVGSTMKSDIDSLKAFLTMSYDQYRMPYGRADTKSPRRTCFCATTNEAEYLLDTTGNRRFWTVPTIKETKIEDIKAFNFQQLWAQVIVEVKATKLPFNLCFRLTEEEKELLNARNERARKPIPAEEQIMDIFAKVEKQGDASWIWRETTVTEWQLYFPNELGRYKANQVSKALRVCEKIPQNTSPERCSDGKVRRMYKLPCRKFGG